MKYSVLILLDSTNQPIGLFDLHTYLGSIVFIFQNSEKLEAFCELTASMVEKDGYKIGWVDLEATSMTQIVRKLLEMDPSLAGVTNFVADSDPLYAQLTASLGG